MPPKNKNVQRKKKNSPQRGSRVGSQFQQEEQKEIAALITPFSPEANGARVCDSLCPNSVGFNVHFNQQVNTGASTDAMFQLHPFFGTNKRPTLIMTVGTSSTTASTYTPFETAAYNTMLGVCRVVGMAMKVQSNVNLQTRQGSVIGGTSDIALMTGSSTSSTYTDMQARLSHWKQYSLIPPDDGCQVRWQPLDTEEYQFQYINDASGVSFGLQGTNSLPTCLVHGVTAGDSLEVEAIIHYEYVPTNADIIKGTPSPFGMRHEAILAASARQPYVASGHSFVEFARVALTVAKTLATITGAVAPILAPLLV